MYLKKDIIFNKENPVTPEWIKPCLYARRKLIEFGIIERYTWTDKEGNVHRYATPELRDKIEHRLSVNKLVSGHHYTDGERVDLEIKLVDMYGFEGRFGFTSIHTYASKDGKKFKYMGSSPADISSDEFIKVKATITHDNYKGESETKLKRIKTL